MEIAYFPDDPPPGWHRPVLALGNFDGLHRGHMKIIDRVRRRAGERGGTPAAMTFDPHPPRVVRPDKAPPLLMSKAQRLEQLEHSRMQGGDGVRFTEELSAGIQDVRPHGARRLAARRRGVGGRQLLFGHDAPATIRSSARSAPCGSAPRRSMPSATKFRRQQHPYSPARRRGTGGRSQALLGHHYFIDRTVSWRRGRGRTIGFRPRISPPRTNSSLRPGCMATMAIDGWSPVHQHRRAADVRRHDDRVETRLRHDPGSLRSRGPAVVRAADAGRAAVSDVDARAQIEADCRSARRLFGRISL